MFSAKQLLLSFVKSGFVAVTGTGDFNNDGRGDLVIAYGYPRTIPFPIELVLGKSGGGFTRVTGTLVSGNPGAVHPRKILIGDLNGDGRDDVFISDHGWDHPPGPGHKNTLLLSAPGGKFINASDRLPDFSDFSHSSAIGDIDGDHDLDIYVNNWAGTGAPTAAYFLINDGKANFTVDFDRVPAAYKGTGPGLAQVDLVDLDGDLDLDMVLGCGDSAVINSTILFNDGSGQFDNPVALSASPLGTKATVIELDHFDVNRDGRMDLLLTQASSSYTGHYMQLFVQMPDGSFVDQTAARIPQTINLSQPWQSWTHVADMDGDGDLDLVTDLQQDSKFVERVEIWTNKGNGTFFKSETLVLGASIELIDLNGDHLLDLVGVGTAGSDSGTVYCNIEARINTVRNGNDKILGKSFDEVLAGGAGSDSLSGSGGKDVLYGWTGNDVLSGGSGNDVLHGEAGADRMSGGAGNDVYYVDSLKDSINEGANLDLDDKIVTPFSVNLVTLASGAIDNALLTEASAVNATGNSRSNELTGNSAANVLNGLGGDDSLVGRGGNDTLNGGNGDDVLNGGAGNDRMFGGSGNDTYYIGNKGDVIDEGASTSQGDTVRSQFSVNLATLDGGSIENAVLLGAASINVVGNSRDNAIAGNNAVNVLDGADGSDKISGLGGNDKISGGNGHDALDGRAGNDAMNGGAGDDTLTGSNGQDTMTGGVGSDTFAFGNASESSVSLPDLISDFGAGDFIRLDAIDADSLAGGDQAFTYIAGNAFSGAAGELQFAGGLLSGDTNGDQIADFSIAVALNGVATIDAGQLIL